MTRKRDDGQIVTINGWKAAAVITQVFSYLATYGFIVALGGNRTDWLSNVGLAAVLEFLLMAGKALIFLVVGKQRSDALGWISVIFDTFLNAGGVWPYVQNGDDTPTWVMLAQSLNMEQTMALIPALIISLVIGFFLSVAPFVFWRRGDS
jgi:hypothetical protein